MNRDPHEKALQRMVEALVLEYGPLAVIRATLIVMDRAIEDMAVHGHEKEAQVFGGLIERMRAVLESV